MDLLDHARAVELSLCSCCGVTSSSNEGGDVLASVRSMGQASPTSSHAHCQASSSACRAQVLFHGFVCKCTTRTHTCVNSLVPALTWQLRH